MLTLTRFGGGGRYEDRDHQQDEEEQVEDPHDCVSNLVNKSGWGFFQNLMLLPSVSDPPLGYRTQRGRSFVRMISLSLRDVRVQRE